MRGLLLGLVPLFCGVEEDREQTLSFANRNSEVSCLMLFNAYSFLMAICDSRCMTWFKSWSEARPHLWLH